MRQSIFYFIAIFSLSVSVFGFQVSFPVGVFDVQGSGKTRSLVIENKNPDLLAVEISVVSRSINDYGVESQGEIATDFDVYPSQLLINPGEDAVVSIVWNGKPPTTERAYRVVTKEIPFNDDRAYKSGPIQVQIGRQYLHAAYVAPPGVRSKIVLESVRVSRNSTTAEMVIVLKNAGTAHQIVSNAELKVVGILSDEDKKIMLKSPINFSLIDSRGRFNLLAGNRYEIVVPWPSGLALSQSIEGELINVR